MLKLYSLTSRSIEQAKSDTRDKDLKFSIGGWKLDHDSISINQGNEYKGEES